MVHWGPSDDSATRAHEQITMANETCAFNPKGVCIRNCKDMTRMPMKNEQCCAVACTSPFRACTACLQERNSQPDYVRSGGATDGLCDFHAHYGATVRRPVSGSDDEPLDLMMARLKRKVATANDPKLASSRERRYEKTAVPVGEKAAELVKQVNLAKRPLMMMANAIEKINSEWHLPKEKIAEIFDITPTEVLQYKNVAKLVPNVHELVDTLGIWAASEISYACPELQLDIANRVLDKTLDIKVVDLYVRRRNVRDPARRVPPTAPPRP